MQIVNYTVYDAHFFLLIIQTWSRILTDLALFEVYPISVAPCMPRLKFGIPDSIFFALPIVYIDLFYFQFC